MGRLRSDHRSRGLILTNYHVLAESDDVVVTLSDGRRFVADVVGADPASDLAVVRIDATNLPHAARGDIDTIQVGEMIWAIGNPFGLDRTLTYGIVSAVGRRGVLDDPYQEFLQTDASINPGNSGVPLVDVHGHVMCITTAIVGQDFRGIGFAIPSNTARAVYEQIREQRHVERGYIVIRRSAGSRSMTACPAARLCGGPRSMQSIQGQQGEGQATSPRSSASLTKTFHERHRETRTVHAAIAFWSTHTVGEPRRVGDRDLLSFGSADDPLRGSRPADATAMPGMSADDCDSVNSARPMRTWFYLARNQRGGIVTATTGDREEMNPPAPPSLRGCGGRHKHQA